MTAAVRAVTILAPEQESQSALAVLPTCAELKLILQADSRNLKRVKNLFIAVSATALPEVADIVKQANDTRLLRALFIHEDVPPEWLPQMMGRAELRMARNVLVHSKQDWNTPRRVIRAWWFGSQHDLIARASVVDDSLLVMNCALDSFQVSFNDLTPLKKIPLAQRAKFSISASGSYIHWQAGDVHLDIGAIRYATDEKWRKKYDLKKLTDNTKFGRAIATLREEHGLSKNNIKGISDRQLRRIENEGAQPNIETLTTLARAHKMNINNYLNELANRC